MVTGAKLMFSLGMYLCWVCICGFRRLLLSGVEHAREVNEMMPYPLRDHEVVAKCKYWWKKTERGENKWGIGVAAKWG
jgi:hypothetical protein